ncbi:hypothetical protein [Bacillus sonorensis]|uniref:hypothetical protein n=1 Tax=Bacillus sonorensis TaxID=119858 RepID=UPI00227ECD54|nr:hypothetical protein [Bacillus sonorensis]MCY7855125.1 hypothetical protein [Bacillus sonorensis]MCY8032000.1 hypothetical protein [Bacillus sonorensis]MCY8270856.1 hypothetical protein [Bacillus sonorensis]MCY8405772.1 hypothetical protein [Bacillus sonorensis]MCY8565377.1 hypothetical protein [Bacillus sonorensis]
MKQTVLNTIEELYHNGDFGYVLFNYVDTEVWSEKFINEIKEIYVDNLTDFNYSKCFTLFIQPSMNPKLKIGTNEFNSFIKENGYLTGILVYISAIAPYASIKYIKYEHAENEIEIKEQYQPFDESTKQIANKIINYLEKENIQILQEDLLEITVPNISLELKEEDVTIFNCLFEDSY